MQEVQSKEYEIYYSIQEDVESETQKFPILDNKIRITLRGREYLILVITFFKEENYKLFKGFDFEIQRKDENYRNYPHQKYQFMKQSYETKDL